MCSLGVLLTRSVETIRKQVRALWKSTPVSLQPLSQADTSQDLDYSLQYPLGIWLSNNYQFTHAMARAVWSYFVVIATVKGYGVEQPHKVIINESSAG